MKYLLFLSLVCFSINLNAQNIVIDKSGFFYQIATIFDFKSAIVSLTFDDGSPNQFTVAMPLLKERNLPATFYLISDLIDPNTKSIIFENLSPVFEIGSHTATHANLIKISKAEAKKELTKSRDALQNLFGKNAALTFAYPWGLYNDSVKQFVKSTYLAARTTFSGFNSLNNLDRYGLRIQSFGSDTPSRKPSEWINYAVANGVWLIEMIHGVNNSGFSPIKSYSLAEHLDYIKNSETDIWCSSVSNVIKYLDESKRAKIECALCNDTIIKIKVNDDLDDEIYDQPLSFRVKVPNSWDSICVENIEKVKIEYFDNNKFVIFNALPDNKLLTIKPGIISVPEDNTGIRIVYLSANPFIDEIRLTLEAFNQRDFDVVLCDLNGKIIFHREEKAVNGVLNLFFDTSGISNGVYFLRVQSNGGNNFNKKLVKI